MSKIGWVWPKDWGIISIFQIIVGVFCVVLAIGALTTQDYDYTMFGLILAAFNIIGAFIGKKK